MVKSGKFEVLTSGTLVHDRREPLELQVTADLRARFVFVPGRLNEGALWEIKIEGGVLIITLPNYGIVGTEDPARVGQHGDRYLYLRVFAITADPAVQLTY